MIGSRFGLVLGCVGLLGFVLGFFVLFVFGRCKRGIVAFSGQFREIGLGLVLCYARGLGHAGFVAWELCDFSKFSPC